MLSYVNNLFGGFSETKEIKGEEVVNIANGKDSDYSRIRTDVGIFPMTFITYYKIIGDKAEETLDCLLTKSIQYLNYGQNRMCYFLNCSAEIDAFVTIYKNDDNFILEVFNWDAHTVENILSNNNVVIEKLDFKCILLEGVSAIDFITEELELSVDYFVYQSHQELDCFGKGITVARTGYTGEYGYKLIGETNSIKYIWGRILPKHKSKIVGYAAFEMCQYEIKQPFWELPYLSLSNNIFEIDYHWFVDFKKDINYIGKDSLYNTKSSDMPKKLIGALSDQEATIGSDVMLDDSVVGTVVDSRFSYGLQKYISMLFVDNKYAHANIPLQTTNEFSLTTVSAPYVFPSSWSAKK